MKILFLTNFYPPYSRGGYEMWCQEVGEELVERGHQLRVLTSTSPGTAGFVDNGTFPVHRDLYEEVAPGRGLAHTIWRLMKDRRRLEQENLFTVRQIIRDFGPDVALMWGMWNIPRSVPALVEQLLPDRVAYYLCDYWPTLPNAYIQRWQEPARRVWTQLPKRLLGPLFLSALEEEETAPLALDNPICVSAAVRDLITERGVNIQHAQIIYGGTRTEPFVAAAEHRTPGDGGLRLLYLGRLEPIKGVLTAIEAMARLPKELPVKLEIYGQGHSDYEAKLRRVVKERNLQEAVTFNGLVSSEEIPAIMAQHDVLLFTSEWDEPFARTVLEAMAARLAVVGTTTGGTGEILHEGRTGLTFRAGDENGLSSQIVRLVKQPNLRAHLARMGQEAVLSQFTLQRMVDELEAELESLSVRSIR